MIAALVGFSLVHIASVADATAATAPESLVTDLRNRDQQLLDAIAPGERSVWDRALTPDAVYVDENGVVMTRADFLKSLEPLPTGISGHIAIVDYHVHRDGDTALVIHKDDEHESYHGIALEANYLMSETWVQRNGEWKLAMVHAYVVAMDPPAIRIPESKLDEYAGRYSAAPDLTWNIRREGDHLVAGRDGAPSRPLSVESQDVLFVPGKPRERRIFQRNAGGKITGFIERREGEDILWRPTQ